MLGFYISGHPLDSYEDKIRECVRVRLDYPEDIPLQKTEALVALVISKKVIKTKDEKKMCAYTLQTKEGEVDAIAFPRTYERIENMIEENTVYAFKGKFSQRNDALSYSIDEVMNPEALIPENISKISIALRRSKIMEKGNVEELKRRIEQNKGEIPVSLELLDEKIGLKLNYAMYMGYSVDAMKEIKELPVVESVRVY